MESPSAVRRGRNLQIRLLTGLVLAPVVLGLTIVGGLPYVFLILVTSVLAVREWVRLVGAREALVIELSYGSVLASLLLFEAVGPRPGLGLMAGLIVLLTAWLWRRRAANRWFVVFGLPYVGIACMSWIWLRQQPEIGLGLMIFLLMTVWATDIGGYAAGRIFGGAKLAPRISPNKTWSGLAGAVLLAGIVGVVVAAAFGAQRPWVALPVAMLLAVLAQAGDLFESAVKRQFGVKDSGRLIPGHGGVLDRNDGLMAAGPALAVFHLMIGATVRWW